MAGIKRRLPKDANVRKKLIKDHRPSQHVIREGCPQRKLSYPSKKTAKQGCALALKLNDALLYPYKCPHCRLWHLTSKKPWD